MALTATQARLHGWDVFRALTVTEIKEERELTIGGLLRWTLEPLSYMVVYVILLGAILNSPRAALPLFLLAALIPFRFFTESMFRSMAVVKSYSSIITNRTFPRELIPLTVLASNATTLVLSFLLLLPFMVLYHTPFTPQLLWLPVIIAVLLVLTAGPTYLGALLGLYFPDYRGAVQNLVRVSFFMSTGLVGPRRVPGEQLPILIDANPLSGIFDSFRAVIMRGHHPGTVDMLYPLGFGLILLAIGFALYRWRQDHFAKEV